jgi:phosphoglycerol transferase
MTGRGGRAPVGLGAVVLVSGGLLVPVFRLWEADLRIPLFLGGDTLFHGMLVKTTVEHGWYARNPDLGFPFGMELHDFPQSGDSLHIALVRVLGWFSQDWALVMNLFFLATFVLAAAAAYVVLRRLGITRYAAVLPSLLFAYLPYHFYRGEAHLFYSGYYGVPFFCLLIIRQLTGRPWLVVRSPEGEPRLSLRHRRALMALLVAAVAASSNVYYATFTVIFLGIGGLVEFVVRRDWRTAA